MTENARPAVAAGAGHVRLRPPRNRVERRAILLWTLHAVAGAAIVLGGLGILYSVWKPARPWLEPLLYILALIYALNIAFMPVLRYVIHRWETTDLAVYSLKGWIEREWRITPISRIQSINTVRGPMQNLLGLATLRVTTAARQGSIAIVGLDATVAEEIARRLTEITQLTPGDAT